MALDEVFSYVTYRAWLDTCVLLMDIDLIGPHACADLMGVGVKEGIGYALAWCHPYLESLPFL